MSRDVKISNTRCKGHAVDDDDVVAGVQEVVSVDVADGRQRDGQLALRSPQVFVFGFVVGDDFGPGTTTT